MRFTFDGTSYTGQTGDTLASALLRNGVRRVGDSVTFGRPRGIVTAGPEEPSAIVQLEAPFAEPMLPATTIELYDGLVARSLSGRGRLSRDDDPARYDSMHAHCDVLVVGAGAAGLAAAREAAASGARVILADEQPDLGGSLLGIPQTHRSPQAAPADAQHDWLATVAAELDQAPEVRVLRRTTVFGYYSDNYLLAVERRTNHLGAAAPANVSRERIWRIRARRVVLATGAHERSVAFADNDRPGVMLAGSVRTYVNRYGVLPGRRAVLFTTNDSAYAAALDLATAGAEVVAVVDARPDPGGWARRAEAAGIEVLAGHQVVGVRGEDEVTGVRVAAVVDGGMARRPRELDADLLAVSGGWNPVLQLYSQAGGRLRADPDLGTFVPAGCDQAVEVVGAAAGLAPEPDGAPPVHLWMVPGPPGTRFVDLQRDVTVEDLVRAAGAGLRSVEHVKRYTTAGTAHDQGKTSGVLTLGVLAEILGARLGSLGTTTSRPPYVPVSFAALAGRDRGPVLHDPVRVTSIHPWHVEHGALFENVGQWKRPWYYPRPGEGMADAVLRECRAAREGVAFMDASTLGKIDAQGKDAGIFLDRLYTNMMSTLKVGFVRYGVMCSADGMVLDDGTVARIAEDRFLTTTTTGNAAMVLDWMEEWLQTEWPELDVRLTSVTDHWVTVALVGPLSRQVLARLAPDLAVDTESFPFMTWRDAKVAGLDARVCRISFSGELAYELNVCGWDGPALWQAVYDEGATPYGTETMHVLRAEKGYPIIGQDTDGTVTPQDLGMSWVVSKKKPDFVGKRSHLRADTSREDRKHLVGLLPEDPAVLLPEGAQLVGTDPIPAPPVPMLGHVTSSYRSAALGRTFALALLRSGRERIGERLYVAMPAGQVPVEVTSPVLYDPEGARRDG